MCFIYKKITCYNLIVCFFFVEFSNLEKRDIKVEVKIEEK